MSEIINSRQQLGDQTPGTGEPAATDEAVKQFQIRVEGERLAGFGRLLIEAAKAAQVPIRVAPITRERQG